MRPHHGAPTSRSGILVQPFTSVSSLLSSCHSLRYSSNCLPTTWLCVPNHHGADVALCTARILQTQSLENAEPTFCRALLSALQTTSKCLPYFRNLSMHYHTPSTSGPSSHQCPAMPHLIHQPDLSTSSPLPPFSADKSPPLLQLRLPARIPSCRHTTMEKIPIQVPAKSSALSSVLSLPFSSSSGSSTHVSTSATNSGVARSLTKGKYECGRARLGEDPCRVAARLRSSRWREPTEVGVGRGPRRGGNQAEGRR